jgi:hypothetical protein
MESKFVKPQNLTPEGFAKRFDSPMFPCQRSWNTVTPLKSTSVFFESVFFEVVLFEVVAFGTESALTVPVTAVCVADLADFALSASIFPPRLQDTNTSRTRKIKNHLLITEECIISPSLQTVF